MSVIRHYDASMSTMQDFPPEPDPLEITSRLRSHMGDKKISRKALALAAGIGRTPLAAKLDDQTSFTLPELLAVARALGKSWIWVMTGVDAPAGPGRGEGTSLPDAPFELATQPSGLMAYAA
jgi:hypothetical protein